MSKQISTRLISSISTTETYDGSISPDDATVRRGWLSTDVTLSGGSTPPVANAAGGEIALANGAATIDLRAIAGTNGGLVDGNGMKVQAVKFRNKPSNANPMTLVAGASDGYDLLGADWKITLAPGQSALLELVDAAPDIGAAAKTIDVSGTGSQVLQMELVVG